MKDEMLSITHFAQILQGYVLLRKSSCVFIAIEVPDNICPLLAFDENAFEFRPMQ